jgi:predicted RNA-binding Zn ribbon-like protein
MIQGARNSHKGRTDPPGSGHSQLLSTVARDVLDLLGSDQIDLVRECDGHDCTRFYVDSSRARNRRWCSNTECGNKAKVSAFRERVRESISGTEHSH